MKLTPPEIKHLLNLLYNEKDEGCYYGNKSQYNNRTERIILKLEKEIK